MKRLTLLASLGALLISGCMNTPVVGKWNCAAIRQKHEARETCMKTPNCVLTPEDMKQHTVQAESLRRYCDK